MYNMDFVSRDLGVKTSEGNEMHQCSASIFWDAAETVLFNVHPLMNYVILLFTDCKTHAMSGFSSTLSVVGMGI